MTISDNDDDDDDNNNNTNKVAILYFCRRVEGKEGNDFPQVHDDATIESASPFVLSAPLQIFKQVCLRFSSPPFCA